MRFEANRGQSDAQVHYLARGAGYTLFLTSDEAVLGLRKHNAPPAKLSARNRSRQAKERQRNVKTSVLRLKLLRAAPRPQVEGVDMLEGKVNYFLGQDSRNWLTDLPAYARVKYRDVYPGVDLVYYGNDGQLEYDFVVAPQADPNVISLLVQGADRLEVDETGNLVMHTGDDQIVWKRPVAYQDTETGRVPVTAAYRLWGNGKFSFDLGPYDASRPLVIDPALNYSTYLGGSSYDFGAGIAVDAQGFAYVTGDTSSSDFPTASSSHLRGDTAVFITKMNQSGNNWVYSTYLGGGKNGDFEVGQSIAIDKSTNVYVVGYTSSTDFPTTGSGYQSSYPTGAEDAIFLAKLNATGSSILYATYLGGTNDNVGYGVAVDTNGNAYVAGETTSRNFPTKNAFQSLYGGTSDVTNNPTPLDAVVAKFNPSASGAASLIYSTFLGGNDDDTAQAIAVDLAGRAYITGFAGSTNFPVTANAYDTNANGYVFITVLGPGGSNSTYSTTFGGTAPDSGQGIAVDSSGLVYVTGYTLSDDFPTTTNGFQRSFGTAFQNAFVSKLNTALPATNQVLYSTYLGGNDTDQGLAIALSSNGVVHVSGMAVSTDFPVTPGAFQRTFGGGFGDAFVAKLDTTASGNASLIYATFLGGPDVDSGTAIATDPAGNAYVAGYTFSSAFPTTTNGFQKTSGGFFDAFVAKVVPSADVSLSVVPSGNPVPVGGTLSYTITVTNRGEAAATNVIVTNVLPSQVAFQSATSTSGTISQSVGVVTARLGGMNNGDRAVVTINTIATAPGLAVNSARVVHGEPDSVTTNDTSTTQVTIGSVVSVAASVSNAFETGTVPGTFRFTRTGVTTDSITVNYSVTGTATVGTDFQPLSGSVTFGFFSAGQEIALVPINDSVTECPESVTVTILPASAYAVGTASNATVTIIDDDPPTVSVQATTPTTIEGGTTNGIFTITRAGCTDAALTVAYAMSGTASNGVDYTALSGSVVIPVNSNSVRVAVAPINDTGVECSETAVLTLLASPGYVVTAPSSDTITVLDNDTRITIAATAASASEFGTNGEFTVFRSGCTTDPVTVNYSVSGTAVNGTDYQTIGTSVVIPAGLTNATVTIQPLPDALNESSETVILTVAASPNYTVGTPSSGTVNIANYYAAPTASFTGSPTNGLAPLNVTFADASIGAIASRTWNFGDGVITNVSSPSATSISHVYAADGVFTVSLAANGPLGTNTLTRTNYISSSLIPPALSVTPANRNFGSIPTGQTNTQTFTVINTGGGLLTGTATVPAPFLITGSPYNLGPSATGTVVVSFAPTVAGSYNANVVFNSNGGVSTNPVSGVAVMPGQMQVSPTLVNFGVVLTGQTAQATMVVTNVGGTAVTNGTVTVNSPFSVLSGTPFTVPGNGSTNVVVRFAPLAGVTFTNSIVFNSANGGIVTNTVVGIGGIAPVASFNASPTSGLIPLTVVFTDTSTGTISNRNWSFGDGTTLDTNVTSFARTYNARGTYTVRLIVSGGVGSSTNTLINLITAQTPAQQLVTPANRDFASVTIGQTNTLTFSVVNLGDLSLSGAATTAPPYRIVSGSPYTVTGGQTGLVSVSFSPVTTGTFNTNVVFTSNAGISTNTVTGAGIAAGQIGVSPATLNFGTKVTGTSTQAAFTVTNTGGTTVSNGTAAVTGGPFSIVSGSTFSLPPGSSTNVVVQFSPVAVGNFTNSVILATANGGSSTNPVIGAGATVPVALFSATPTNGPAPLAVTFTDSSTGTITNRSWSFGDGTTSNTTLTSLTKTYTAAGTNTVQLIVAGPVGVSTNTQLNLIRVINPPILNVSPSNRDFGAVTTGQTNTLNFSVLNTGDQTLTGSVATTSPFLITAGSPFSVLPGQTGTISVSFAPAVTGTFNANAIFNSNGGVSTNTLIGVGVTAGSIGVSPVALNFGTIATGTTSQGVFTVTNSGGTVVSNGTAAVSGGPYSILSGANFSLPPGGSTNVVVQFAPVSTGSFTNAVLFNSANGGSSSNQIIGSGAVVPAANFTATPTNGAAPLSVTFPDTSTGTITNRNWSFGDGTTSNTTLTSLTKNYTTAGTNTVRLIASGPLGVSTNTRANLIIVVNPPQQVISPTSRDFGAVTIGATNTLAFSVINTGDQTLTGNATVPAPFAVSGGSYNVSAGQTGTVSVSFIPVAPGPANASVVFSGNGGVSTNAVTGTGLTPGQIGVSPSGLNFGTIATGTTSQSVFTVTNSGGTDVSNGVAAVTGGPYSIIAGATFRVPAGGSTNVTVRFAPVAAGAFTNAVIFTTANGGSSSNQLTGTGAIVPSADFSAAPTTGAVPVVVTFTDSSTGTITNRNWSFGDGTTLNTNATSFTKTYTVAGTNTVSLIASGPVGVSTNTKANLIMLINPPQLVVLPASRDFGAVTIGATNTLPFSVINTGDQTLNGTATVSGPFAVGGSPYTVNPGQTGTVSVSFIPVSAGLFNASVVFSSNGGASTNAVAGTGLTPGQIGVSPVALNFGTVATGATSQGVFTVSNSGGTDVSNGVASVTGGPYSILAGAAFTVPAGGSTNVTVRFAPVAAGAFTNAVMFTTANGGSSSNQLTGTGAIVPSADFSAAPTTGAVPVVVTFTDTSTGTITNRNWSFGDGTTLNTNATSFTKTYTVAGTNTVRLIASGPVGVSTNTKANLITLINPPQLLVVPLGHDFGAVTIGQTNTLPFLVINTGDQLLNGTAAVGAPFALTGSPYTVNPGQTGTVAVSFIPVAPGLFNANVIFSSNGGVSTNSVTGTGLTPGQIGVSPVALNFGTLATGTTSQGVFTVTNSGGTDVSNGVATVTGGPYTIVGGAAFTVPAGGSTNVTVQFAPVTAGGFTNAVIFDTDNGGSSTNQLTGTGAVVPSANFTATPTNGVVPFVVTFTDTSTGTITNRNWSFGDGSTVNTNGTSVTHTYSVAGTNTVRLIVNGPVGVSTNTKPNFIVGIRPALISVSPANQSFGAVTIGQSNLMSFVVSNLGDVSLNGTAATAAPFSIVSGSPFAIGAGQTGIVTVAFVPSSAGSVNGNVIFTSDGGVSTNSVTGVGRTPGQIGVTPLALNFGTLATGTISQQVFVVSNAGGTDVSNGVATVSAPYSILAGSPFAVAAGASTNVTVRFAPVAAGAFTNNVIFTTANGGNSTNQVTGTGAVVPTANFTATPTNGVVPFAVAFTDTSTGTITNRLWSFGDGGTLSTTSTSVNYTYTAAGTNTVRLIVSGPVGVSTNTKPNLIVGIRPALISVNPVSQNFGALTIGDSNSLTFAVSNLGDVTLNGTAATAAPFSIASGSPFAIAAGQTGTITVKFAPVIAGNFNGNVIFASNGGDSTNAVNGVGLTPGQIGISPSGLDFGTIATGTTSQRVFIVTNSGGTAVSNGTATVTGGPYNILSGNSFSLAAGASSNVVVQFAPVAAGGFTNSVIFSSANGGSSTNTITGTGAVVPLANFTATPTNGVVPFVVTFTDTSTGTITNRNWDFGGGAISNTTQTTISHTYTVAGTNTVRLIVNGPVGVSTNTKPNLIVGINPASLVVSPASRDFGAVTTGFTNSLSFSVFNPGDVTLTGTASAPAPFLIISGSPFNIAGRQTGTVVVAFAPVAAGTFNNNVIFSSNGGVSTNPVSGVGLTPGRIVVNPGANDFGTIATGTSSQRVFMVTNTGGTTVSNGVASTTAPFSIVSGNTFTLLGGASANVTVQFAPVAAGAFSNSVLFTSANGGNATNIVTGVGAVVPSANFTASPTTGSVPFSVTFIDSSSGTITNRFWDFGDGATTNVTTAILTHTYSTAGTNSVSLTVSGPVGVSALTKPNLIIGFNPAVLVVTPTSRAFGPVTIGQTNSLTFSVFNPGDLPLNGSAGANAPFAIAGGSPFTVNGGQTGTVTVSFIPVAPGTFNDNVVFTSNGGVSTNALSGVGLTPGRIGVSPASLNFATIAVGSTSQQVFTVTNSGGTPVSNGTAAVSAPFSIVSGGTFSLAGGASTNVTVQFAPGSVATFTDAVVFGSANGGSSTNTVTGSGAIVPAANFSASPTNGPVPLVVTFTDTSTGTITNRFWNFGDGATTNTTVTSLTHTYTVASTNSVLLVASGPLGASTNSKPNLIVAVNPPRLVVSPLSRNFGAVTLGTSNALTFTVQNTGDLPLNGTAAGAGPFAVTGGSPYSVGGGQTGTVTVSFAPVTAGVFSNSVVFASNGGGSTNLVTGIGRTPGQLFITPTSFNYGIIPVNNSTQAVFSVSNLGGTTVSNGTATVTGGPYAVVSGSSFELAAGASVNVIVSFTPTQVGSFTNAVIFASANGGSSTNALTGGAAFVPVANFSASPVTGLLPLTVNFTDESTGTISDRLWTFGDGQTSSQTNPSHPYTISGNFTVTLRVSGPAGTSTNIKTSLITVVDPNLLTRLAGTFYGLSLGDPPTFENSGLVVMKIASTGQFNGTLQQGKVKNKFAGTFDQLGNANTTVARSGLAALTMALHLDGNGSEQVTGTVAGASVPAALILNRDGTTTSPSPLSGRRFTALIPADTAAQTVPLGDGYATVLIKAPGKVGLAGVTGDGQKIKQQVPVSKYGTWPMYVALNNGAGALFGWVTHTNVVGVSDFDATLHWHRPAGLADNIFMVGSLYTPPAAGQRVLNFPPGIFNALLRFGDGNLPETVVSYITVMSDNKVIGTNVTMKIITPTGLFNGKFSHPVSGASVPFRGAVLQKQNFGSGVFLGPSQPGFVNFEPAP